MTHSTSGECSKVQGELDAYLSGEVSASVREAIAIHLADCPDCSRELEARRGVRALLKGVVDREVVPPYLESKIRANIAQPRNERRSVWSWAPAFAAAAVLVIVAVVGWNLLRPPSDPRTLSKAGQDQYVQALFEKVAGVVQIGLGDHLHCTYFRTVRKGAAPAEEMENQMGPEYAALVPLVQEKVPTGFVIATAHRCKYKGRSFVHMVLRRDDQLLSLIMTRREGGEQFQGAGLDVVNSGGAQIFEQGAERFAVAGFEAGDHLAFVVSELPAAENLAWAERLAGPVVGFLGETRS